MSLGMGEGLLPGPQHLQEVPRPLLVSRRQTGGWVFGIGVWGREDSGIGGGWRLELSFFHGGAVREGAFEEPQLVEDVDEQAEQEEPEEDG